MEKSKSQILREEIQEKERLLKIAELNERENDNAELINRLLLSLKDQPLKCSLPIQTVAHVKKVFDYKSVDCQTCYFADTCKQVLELTGKKSISQKSTGERSGKLSSTNLKKVVSKGCIQIVDKSTGKIEFSYIGTDYNDYLTKLRAHFYTGKPQVVRSEFIGLTKSGVQGFEHKGKDNCLLKKFEGR